MGRKCRLAADYEPDSLLVKKKTLDGAKLQGVSAANNISESKLHAFFYLINFVLPLFNIQMSNSKFPDFYVLKYKNGK